MTEEPLNAGANDSGWESLASLLGLPHPLFERTLFLQGYDLSSNIYLLLGDYLTLIDPGNDYTAFMDLAALGYELSQIKKVVLTHGHVDHVMGTFELYRGYPGIFKDRELEVILHEAGPEEFRKQAHSFGCRLTEIKGGETLNLSGFEFEVIHTPGHTLDGICLYHAPTRTLFAGDTVLPHAMAELDTNAGGRMDHYLYSLRTLLKREIDHIMPGHGGLVANMGRRVMEETYDGLIKRLVGLETPLMEGVTTLAQKGLLEEALFYTDKELAHQPDNSRALETKAFLLNDLGRCREAVEIFDKVLAQKHDYFYGLMGKGTALMGMGKHLESLEYFDRALTVNPNNGEALGYKGMALYLAGRYEEAMAIEPFRRDFSQRFQQELLKKGHRPTSPEG
jgi:glyoxylase-like metal-dependent hydrolase (beta-lactamase superfamily II)